MPEEKDIAGTEPITELDELIDKVRELVQNPVNVWAVAATIESLGLRDVDAKNDFGFDSVFDLAGEVYSRIKDRVGEEQKKFEQDLQDGSAFSKASLGERSWQFIKFYVIGLFFSLPMLSQIIAILIFRYSLWAWLEFNEAQATVVAFGTIAAFVVTGGFTQALGRSVSKYKSEGNYSMAYKATRKIVKGGVVTTFGVVILFYLLNLIIPFYPQGMIILGLGYLALISLLLLASAILYAVEQRLMILFIVVLGTAVVIVGMDVLNVGIYISQWVGMGFTIFLLLLYSYGYFKLKIYTSEKEGIEKSLPQADVRYYINYRYFIYGFTYFLFLFMDRILAWTAGPPPTPYIMWFNTPYELGMDWALLSLILTIAVLEYSVNAFSKQLMPLQKKAILPQMDQFINHFKKFYFRQLLLLLIIGIASIFVTYYSINSIKVYQEQIPEIRDFFANPMTTRVFWAASIAYLFVVIGLLHTLFFFTLHRPKYAMYSILAAVVVNFLVGFICSRVFSLEYAVLGLVSGSITFALISGIIAKSFFKRLDYYYYSAF